MFDRTKVNGVASAIVAGSLAVFAGSASAQFVVDAAAEPQARETTTKTQTIAMTTNDGKSYKVFIEGDAVVEAWANGEPVDATRVTKDAEGIYFLDDKGNITETIRLSITPPETPGSFRFPGQPSLPGMAGAPEAPRAMGFFSGDDNTGMTWTAKVEMQAPPVMLGINLSSPGDALRSQLRLGDLPAILVDGVIDGLPASNAGLEKYDIIVSLDGSEGSSSQTLSEVLADKEAGEPLEMHVIRGGKKIHIVAKLAAYDAKALGQEPAIVFDERRFPGLATRSDDNQDVQVWIDRGKGQLEQIERDYVAQMEDMRRALRERAASEEEMRSKVAEAMREAERRVLELRGGQLFVREADEVARRAAEEITRLERHLAEEMPEIEEELDERFAEIEERFEAMEERLEEQAERLGDRMERLMALMERMADRIERAFDEE